MRKSVALTEEITSSLSQNAAAARQNSMRKSIISTKELARNRSRNVDVARQYYTYKSIELTENEKVICR